MPDCCKFPFRFQNYEPVNECCADPVRTDGEKRTTTERETVEMDKKREKSAGPPLVCRNVAERKEADLAE